MKVWKLKEEIIEKEFFRYKLCNFLKLCDFDLLVCFGLIDIGLV